MSVPSPSLVEKIKEPKVGKIEISIEDLAELKKIQSSKRYTPSGKDAKQRKMVGLCFDCGDIPDYIVTRYYEGATAIERYCAKCLQQEQDKGNITTTIITSVSNNQKVVS